MPTSLLTRLTRIWIALSAAWLALFPLVLVVATDHDSLHAWLGKEMGWVWLLAPPLALGIVLKVAAGMSYAMFRRSALYWEDLPGEAKRAAKPAARRSAAPAVDLPRKGKVGEPVRVWDVEPTRRDRRARR